jgi:uncharacterized membrane protein
MRDIRSALIALIAVVTLVTLFVRIPLPTGGFFNIGDVAVVFAGLVLGDLASRRRFWWGATAGGLGSALADIIGGFPIFAPVTLVAKGLEGGLAALAAKRSDWMQYGLLILGGLTIVVVYFVGEWLMPNIGLQGAVSEVLPNLLQATAGVIGGRLTFAAYKRIVGESAEASDRR